MVLEAFFVTLAAVAFFSSCFKGSLIWTPSANPERSCVGFGTVFGGNKINLLSTICKVKQSPSSIPSLCLIPAGMVIFPFWSTLICSPNMITQLIMILVTYKGYQQYKHAYNEDTWASVS
jgi:hypothetical protein